MKTNCDICGNEIFLDAYGNGKCKKCHWIKNAKALDYPNDVIYPNVTSFNNAKMLLKNGKRLKPTYAEFLKIVNNNLEPTFKYKNKTYVATTFDGFELCEQDSGDQYQSYNTIEEFGENVKIEGCLLKDIWDSVKNFQLGC